MLPRLLEETMYIEEKLSPAQIAAKRTAKAQKRKEKLKKRQTNTGTTSNNKPTTGNYVMPVPVTREAGTLDPNFGSKRIGNRGIVPVSNPYGNQVQQYSQNIRGYAGANAGAGGNFASNLAKGAAVAGTAAGAGGLYYLATHQDQAQQAAEAAHNTTQAVQPDITGMQQAAQQAAQEGHPYEDVLDKAANFIQQFQ